jgi:TP901 family phage tail tape measure protein
MTEVGVGYVSIVPSARNFAQALGAQITPQLNAVGQVASASLSARLMGVGGAMTKFVTVPIAAAAAASVAAALKIDKSMDRIAAQTGATGDALAGLQESFRRVGRGAQQDWDTVADVVSGLNTRLGLTGQELESASSAMLNFAYVTGVDAAKATASVTKAMNQFGLEASQTEDFLDLLLSASQRTGIGVDKLADQVAQFAPTLRALGFPIADSVEMLASFERAGVNTSQVMSGMRIGVRRLADDLQAAGRSTAELPEAFREAATAIRDAETDVEAITLATALFGRSGTEMATALRDGRISVDELTGSLEDSRGTLKQTIVDMFGLRENVEKLKKSFTDLFAMIGAELTPIIDSLSEKVAAAAQAFADMDKETREQIVQFGLLAAAAGPVLFIVGKIAGAVSLLTGGLAGLRGAMMFLLGPIGWKIALLGAAVGAVMWLWNTSEEFRTAITDIWSTIQEVVGGVIETVNQFLADNAGAVEALRGVFEDLWATIESRLMPQLKTFAEEVLPKVGFALEALVPIIVPLVGALLWLAASTAQVAADFAVSVATMSTAMLTAATQIALWLGQALISIMQWGENAWAEMVKAKDRIVGVFANAGEWLTQAGRDIVQGLINGITGMIGSAVAKAAELASSVVGAVTGLLKIGSPSRVFIGIGEDVTDGLVIGLGRGQPRVADAISALAMSLPDTVRPARPEFTTVETLTPGNTYNVVMESVIPATPDEVASSLQRLDVVFGGGRW